jgi:hypothetical protein
MVMVADSRRREEREADWRRKLADFVHGGQDTTQECLAEGAPFEWIEEAFRLRLGREKAEIEKARQEASLFLSKAQPRVDPEPEILPPPGPKVPRRRLPTPEAKRWVLVAQPKEKEPEAEPEPQAQPAKKPLPRIQLPAVVPPRKPPAVADWSDVWGEALEAMNKQHAIIENVGGKAVIASWEPALIDPSRRVVVFQNKESFLLRYSNREITLETIDGRGNSRQVKVPLGSWWLGHRYRRQHRGVTFAPAVEGTTVNGCLNLWQGWGVEEQPGDWGLVREHIEKVLAGGNAEFADYVIRWIAWAIQNPAAQAEVALVLIGAKGAGKGTLVRCLQRIFGAHSFQVTSREEVIGKFNGHLQDCILFVADEAYWGGDKRCVGRLQGMITEPTLPIERKGIDLIQVPNFLHVVMLAEPGWVIPAGRYERRYAALAVSAVKRGDRAYFRALHRQIEHGGAAAMFYELRRMELGDWHPRDIPEALLTNSALQKQQDHTLPPLEQWYLMLLHKGVLPGALPEKPNTAYTMHLLADAKDQFPRLRLDLTEPGLRNFLIDEERIGIACTKYRSSSNNGWNFPPLGEARKAWEKRYGPVRWDCAVEEWHLPEWKIDDGSLDAQELEARIVRAEARLARFKAMRKADDGAGGGGG